MKKSWVWVLVVAILALLSTFLGVALGETNGSDCASCHGTKADFTVTVSTTNCVSCHADIGYLYEQHYNGVVPGPEYWDSATWNGYGTFQETDPLSKAPLEMHNFHRDTGEGCTWCHAYSGYWNNYQPTYVDCGVCHTDVSHQIHGNVESVEVSVINNIGVTYPNQLFQKSYTCLNSSCHGMPTNFQMPFCLNCHTVGKEGHGDVTEKHLSPELTSNCLDSGCHYSNYLTTEHENRGYTCDTCHNYTGTKLDPQKVRDAIDTDNTNCSACHKIHHDPYPFNSGKGWVDAKVICMRCHAQKHSHMDKRHDCGQCHNPGAKKSVHVLTYVHQTYCGECHTSAPNYTSENCSRCHTLSDWRERRGGMGGRNRH